MSTSITDFSASGPAIPADVLSGSGPGASEAQAGESSTGSSAFAQAFAQKLADLAAQTRAKETAAVAVDGTDVGRQEFAADSIVVDLTDASSIPANPALDIVAGLTDPATLAAQAAVAAAAAAALPALGGGSGSTLTTVALSPGLNVIKPLQADPDGQSLLAFARAQGLDDRAVLWLFGNDPSLQGGKTLVNGGALPGMGLAEGSPVAKGVSPSEEMSASAQLPAASIAGVQLPTVPVSSPVSSSLVSPLAQPGQIAQAAGASGGALPSMVSDGSVSNGVTGGLAAAVTAAAGEAKLAASQPLASADAQPGAVAAAAALAWLRDGTSKTSASLWGPGNGPTVAAGRGAAPQADDPSAAVLQISKLMPASGPRATAVSGPSQRTAATPSRPVTGTLDLSSSLDPELVEWIEARGAAGTSSSRSRSVSASGSSATSFEGGAARVLAQWAKAEASATPQGVPAAAPAAANNLSGEAVAARAVPHPAGSGFDGVLSNAQERAQRLSDRLGEAVGQRMLTELEKGNWHLQLKLRPETLGSIEVEMHMHGGQLNAQFSAQHAMTRDLLADSLTRLKDTLAQMGMNVAQMNVNGGRSQQRGGDSTPRQSQGVRAPEATTQTQEPDAKNQSRISSLLPGSGWDVLV